MDLYFEKTYEIEKILPLNGEVPNFMLAFLGYPFAPSFFIFLSRELTDVFEKNEKKSKTTSVYRLEVTIPGKEKFCFCCLFLVRKS